MPKKKLNRILIKLSGESLMGKNKFGIDLNTVKRISNDLLSLKKLKIQICVVIGGGNIFRGLAASAKGMDRASADYMGMLATVMNSLALQNSLEKLKVETRVMSAFPIQSICETYIRRRAIRHMEKNRIVILIVFISISLLGIILLQGYWIKNAIDTYEKQFSQNTNNALITVADAISDREMRDYLSVYQKLKDRV